jgi:hypothetical protein
MGVVRGVSAMLLAYQENGLPSHDDSPKVSGEGNGKV